MGVGTVVGKIVALLSAFGADDDLLSLAELTRRTGLAKGTAHRLAASLVEARLLERVTGGYRLGGHLFELGMLAAHERRLLEVASPFMQDLHARTGEVVHLGVTDGTEVMYLHKLRGHLQAPVPTRAGGRRPLYNTAIGKALLASGGQRLFRQVVYRGLERHTPRTIVAPSLLRAELIRVEHDGAAYEYEESAVGIACVAAPVRDRNKVIAAISVTGLVTRFRPKAHSVAVQAAAAGIAAALVHSPPRSTE
jgi:DNA-binding IclR family transcriptional regulator